MSLTSLYLVLLVCVICCLAIQRLPGAHRSIDMFATDDDTDGNHEIVGCQCPVGSYERCKVVPKLYRYLPVGEGACNTQRNKFYRCTAAGMRILGCCDNKKVSKKGVGLNAKTSGYYYSPDGLEYKGRRGGITKKGTVTCSTNYRYTFHSNMFKNANQTSSRLPISFDKKEDVAEHDQDRPDTNNDDGQP